MLRASASEGTGRSERRGERDKASSYLPAVCTSFKVAHVQSRETSLVGVLPSRTKIEREREKEPVNLEQEDHLKRSGEKRPAKLGKRWGLAGRIARPG